MPKKMLTETNLEVFALLQKMFSGLDLDGCSVSVKIKKGPFFEIEARWMDSTKPVDLRLPDHVFAVQTTFVPRLERTPNSLLIVVLANEKAFVEQYSQKEVSA